MTKYKVILSLLIVPLFLSNSIKKPKETKAVYADRWSGTVSYFEKKTDREIALSEWRMDATIVNNKGIAVHTMKFDSKKDGVIIDCRAEGKTELEVDINYEAGEYGITVPLPGCEGVSDETAIVINKQRLGSNRNVLSGTTTDRYGPDENGDEIVTTYTWSLVNNASPPELIVTPHNYDNWLPERGPDGEESSLGNKMMVSLRLQETGGGVPAIKATLFELRLSNTSDEKGTTINYPISPPHPPPAPDLRFLEQEDAQLREKNQVIKITPDNGTIGDLAIGSYDGGGWSTLTAVAILENGDSVKGTLLRPGGITEIPIPKRKPGSKIATAWLAANGNPADRDDTEISSGGNTNIGDGLSAYEEYRGVFSHAEFRRLDPKKKELGIKVKVAELDFFREGIGWFENASGIDVIPFYIYEIDADRKLNGNGFYAHLDFQCVLEMMTGIVDGAYGRATGGPGIPKDVTKITIDISKLNSRFQSDSIDIRPSQLPYTRQERIARTVAHEMAHGVNVWHHGSEPPLDDVTARDSVPRYLLLKKDNSEITRRPQHLINIGKEGNAASGDLFCFVCYTFRYSWSFIGNHNGSPVYYEVPQLAVGKKLCTSKTGTDINDPNNKGVNNMNKYFANATRGNCFDQVKLK